MIANLPPWEAEENEKKRLSARKAPDHPPGILAVVVRAWVDVRAAEVHVVSAATIVPRSGPIVPAGITVADRRTIHVPGIDEVIWI